MLYRSDHGGTRRDDHVGLRSHEISGKRGQLRSFTAPGEDLQVLALLIAEVG